MNKIKHINISYFRIYEGKQEFNFENSGVIANLVVLYAPNGYGKTSFYDAIEWSFSDKINRIGDPQKNEEVKELDYNKNIKDKIVLTNRKSYKLGKKGEVEIITEKGDVKKEVNLHRRPNTNTKFDYRKGTYTGSFKENDLSQLPSINILSQDQIDSFLRHTNAEEKFKQLDKFASQVKSDLDIFRKVDNIYTSLSKRLINLEKDLSKKEKNIEQIKIDKFDISSMNNIISKINEIERVKNNNIRFTHLNELNSSKELKKFKENLIRIKNMFRDQLSENKNKIDIAKELLNTFNIYQSSTINLDKCIDTINSLNNKKKLYADKIALKELIDKQRKSVDHLNRLLNKYYLLLDYTPEVKNILIDIKKENKSINRNKIYQQKAKTTIANLNKRIQELKQDINIQTITVSRYKDYIKEKVQQEVEKKEYQKHINLNEKKITKVECDITPIKTKLTELTQKKVLFTQILNDKNWDNFGDYANDEYIRKYKLYVKHIIEKEDLDKQQIAKDKELKASGSLQENLKRIKEWGSDYSIQKNIRSADQTTCPLCNTSFANLQLLLDAIDKDSVDALNISKIEDEIKKISKRKNELLQENTKIEVFFTDTIKQLIKELIEPIEKYSKKLEDLDKLRSNYYLEIKTAEGKIKLLEQKASNTIPKLNIPKSITAEEYPQYIQNQIKKFKHTKAKNEHNIEKYSYFVWSINSTVADCEIKINKSETKIFTLKNNNYNEFSKLIKECNLQPEDVISPNFESKYIELKKQEKQRETHLLSEYENKKNTLEDKIKKHKCKDSEELIEGKLIEGEAKRKDLNESINIFTKKGKSIGLSDIKSIEQINKFVTIEIKDTDALTHVQKNIELLSSKVEIVEKEISKELLKKDLETLKKTKAKYTNAQEKIRQIRINCITYLQKGIETTFNKNVINKIYSRIEPHPSLKEINFRAEIVDKGPRLTITAKGENDEVNPNLFLSAGQVNILSLSIFLAKAYEYGSEIISTIFMDDPIQNLSDINILSFIDILRTLTQDEEKQIIISTHDEKFFRLLQNKMPEEYCKSKFIEFEAPGVVKK